MKIDNQQIVCVGNSHLASFSKALNAALADAENVSLKFWPIQYMANPWDNFNANRCLAAPRFKANNPAGLPDIDGILENKSILVLVGIGISGNLLFAHFGELSYANPAEMPNGYSHSPLMPYVYGDNIDKLAAMAHLSKREAPYCSVDMCMKMFENSINEYLNILSYLRSNSPFERIYSVPAPNMPDRVARWRLGEDYCDSRCQRVINDIYRKTLDELVSSRGFSEHIILHDVGLENEFGFIYDRYANSSALNDNHVNQEYCEHIVCDLLGRITRSSVNG